MSVTTRGARSIWWLLKFAVVVLLTIIVGSTNSALIGAPSPNQHTVPFQLNQDHRVLILSPRLTTPGSMNIVASWTGTTQARLVVHHGKVTVAEAKGNSPLSMKAAFPAGAPFGDVRLINLDGKLMTGTLSMQGNAVILPTYARSGGPAIPVVGQTSPFVEFRPAPSHELVFSVSTNGPGWIRAEVHTFQPSVLRWRLVDPNGNAVSAKNSKGLSTFQHDVTSAGRWRLVLANGGPGVVRGQVFVKHKSRLEYEASLTAKLNQLATRPRKTQTKVLLGSYFHSMERSLLGYPNGKSKVDSLFDSAFQKHRVPVDTRRQLVARWKALPTQTREKLLPKGWTKLDPSRPVDMELLRLKKKDIPSSLPPLPVPDIPGYTSVAQPAIDSFQPISIDLVFLERSGQYRFWIFFSGGSNVLLPANPKVAFFAGTDARSRLGDVDATMREQRLSIPALGIDYVTGRRYFYGQASAALVTTAQRIEVGGASVPLPTAERNTNTGWPFVTVVQGPNAIGQARRGDMIEVQGWNFNQGARILRFNSTFNVENPRWTELEAGYFSPERLTFRYSHTLFEGNYVIRVANSGSVPVIDPTWTTNLTVSGMAVPVLLPNAVTPASGGAILRPGMQAIIKASGLPPAEDLVDYCNSGFMKVRVNKVNATTAHLIGCDPVVEPNAVKLTFWVPDSADFRPPRGAETKFELRLQLSGAGGPFLSLPYLFAVTGEPFPTGKVTLAIVESQSCVDDVDWESGCDSMELYMPWVAFYWDGRQTTGFMEFGTVWGPGTSTLVLPPAGVMVSGPPPTFPLIEVRSQVIVMYQLNEDDPNIFVSLDMLKDAFLSGAAAAGACYSGAAVECISAGGEFLFDVMEIVSTMGAGDDIGAFVYFVVDPESLARTSGPAPAIPHTYLTGSRAGQSVSTTQLPTCSPNTPCDQTLYQLFYRGGASDNHRLTFNFTRQLQ